MALFWRTALKNEELTAALLDCARASGADLIGIADIDRFREVPAQSHPSSIFPETRSVVVLGKRVARGCLRGIEEGSQFSIYSTYANNWVPHRILALATVRVASWLEDHRWEAVPIPDLPKQVPPMGVPVRDGAPAPNVMMDFADAAVRAGLGEIGYTGQLMTPEFGHLQRLHVILTDAPLTASQLFEGTVCDRCRACAAGCPLNAFRQEGDHDTEILGKRMCVAKIDADACRSCRNGALPNPSHPSGPPDRTAAACMRACVVHMEKAGVLKRRFHNAFRHRPAWAVNKAGEPVIAEGGAQ